MSELAKGAQALLEVYLDGTLELESQTKLWRALELALEDEGLKESYVKLRKTFTGVR